MSLAPDPGGPEQFRNLVAARFGLRFDDAKLGFLGDLLRRRAEARGLPIAGYLAEVDTDEAGPLAEELTVGETYFFRNNDQFRAFREIVLPDRMRARGGSGRLSLLSAGCSSGEEPFTLAMICAGAVPPPAWHVAIRAVDLNPAALRKAASGRYSSWALRETPADMQQQWFVPQGKDMLLSPAMRDAVRFDRRNLADPAADIWEAGAYDAIFCRNVIMYFTPQIQQAVIARIARSLTPGGYLFLGHAETLRGLSQDFHLRHTHDTFYYQRRTEDEVASGVHQPIDLSAHFPRPEAARFPAPGIDANWFTEIGNASRRIEALMQPAPVPAAPAIAARAPQPAAPQFNIASALDLLQRERFADALDLIGRMPEAAAADPDVLLLQASLLIQSGKAAAAAEVCRVLLSLDELNAGANYVLGLCFESSGDAAAALLHYDLAIHLDAAFAMPLLRRGMLSRRARKPDQARADLTQALELLKLEDASRLLLFGGGFTRAALSRLCKSELRAIEAMP